MNPKRLFTLFITTVIAAAALTACSPSTPQTPEDTVNTHSNEKTGDGVERTDLAPIAKRWPQLAAATSVTWMSGTMSSHVPGPTTYWVDAVAVLPQSEIDALTKLVPLQPTAAPTLVDKLAQHRPAGPYSGSDELNRLFSAAGYSASVAIDPATRTVVLSGVFG